MFFSVHFSLLLINFLFFHVSLFLLLLISLHSFRFMQEPILFEFVRIFFFVQFVCLLDSCFPFFSENQKKQKRSTTAKKVVGLTLIRIAVHFVEWTSSVNQATRWKAAPPRKREEKAALHKEREGNAAPPKAAPQGERSGGKESSNTQKE